MFVSVGSRDLRATGDGSILDNTVLRHALPPAGTICRAPPKGMIPPLMLGNRKFQTIQTSSQMRHDARVGGFHVHIQHGDQFIAPRSARHNIEPRFRHA